MQAKCMRLTVALATVSLLGQMKRPDIFSLVLLEVNLQEVVCVKAGACALIWVAGPDRQTVSIT